MLGRHPSTWWEIHQFLRKNFIYFVDDARRERDLLSSIMDIDMLYQKQMREARCLHGWISFLKGDDLSDIERNEWDEKSTLHQQLASQGNVGRFTDFVHFLRQHPEVLAFVIRVATPFISKKLQAVLGLEPEKGAQTKEQTFLLETICFSMFGNVFHQRDFLSLREVVRHLIEFDLSTTPDIYSIFPPTFDFETPHSSSKVLLLLFRRFGGMFFSRILRKSLLEIVLKESHSIDPNPQTVVLEAKGMLPSQENDEQPIYKRQSSLLSRFRQQDPPSPEPPQASSSKQQQAPFKLVNTAEARRLIDEKRFLLSLACDVFLDSCLDERQMWPLQLLYLLKDALSSLRKLVPDKYEAHKARFASRVVFGLGVLPALKECNLSGVFTEMPFGSISRMNVDVVVMMLAVLLMDYPLAGSHYLHYYDEYFTLKKPMVHKFVADLIHRAEHMPDPPLDCELRVGTVAFKIIELVHLHQMLFKHEQKWDFPPQVATALSQFQTLSKIPIDTELMQSHYAIQAHPSKIDDSQPAITDLINILPSKVKDVSMASVRKYTLTTPQRSQPKRQHESKLSQTGTLVRVNQAGEVRAEYLRVVVQLIVRALLLADDEFLLGYTGDHNDLLALIEYVRLSLDGKLITEWETASTLFSIIRELEEHLTGDVPEEVSANRFGVFRSAVAEVCMSIFQEHNERWMQRQHTLVLALESAKHHLAHLKDFCKSANTILFNHKVLAFTKAIEIPCRLQLPPAIHSRHSIPTSKPKKPKGPLFYCGSVITFIKEFTEYGESLRHNPHVAAKVLHTFLEIAHQRCAHDAAFVPSEIDQAMELIENYVTCHIFSDLFFMPGAHGNDVDDAYFEKLCRSLSWIEPSTLDLLNAHISLKYWERAIKCVKNLDDHFTYRSPQGKLGLITQCVKWLVKVLQAKTGNVGTDADTSLSGLIYVIVKAQPCQLPTNLFYVATYRPESKLIGEDGYCLTQFTLALRFIVDTLSNLKPESEKATPPSTPRKQPISVVDMHTAHALPLHLQRIFTSLRIRHCLMSFFSMQDMSVVKLVCKQFYSMVKTLQESTISINREGKLMGIDQKFDLIASQVFQQNAPDAVAEVIDDGKPAVSKEEEDFKNWNENLEVILEDSTKSADFVRFARKTHAEENVLFVLDVQRYKALPEGSTEQSKTALSLYKKYLCPAAELEIDSALPQHEKRRLIKRIAKLFGLMAPILKVEDGKQHKSGVTSAYSTSSATRIPIRVNLNDSAIGSHITLMCQAGDSVLWVKQTAIDLLKRKTLLPADAKSTRFSLIKTTDSTNLTENEHFSIGRCFKLHEVLDAASTLTPLELTLIPTAQPIASAKSMSLTAFLNVEDYEEDDDDVSNLPSASLFDDAYRRVMAHIRVALLPGYIEYLEQMRHKQQ